MRTFWPDSWKPQIPPHAIEPLWIATMDIVKWLHSARGEHDLNRQKKIAALMARVFMAGFAAGKLAEREEPIKKRQLFLVGGKRKLRKIEKRKSESRHDD